MYMAYKTNSKEMYPIKHFSVFLLLVVFIADNVSYIYNPILILQSIMNELNYTMGYLSVQLLMLLLYLIHSFLPLKNL